MDILAGDVKNILPKLTLEPPSSDIQHTIFKWIYIILYFLLLILITIFTYFSFSSIAQLTIYSFFYEWISLFSKPTIHLIFSILANLSDFGLVLVLAMLCIYVIKDFLSLISYFFSFFYMIVSGKEEEYNNNEEGQLLKLFFNIDKLSLDTLNEKIILLILLPKSCIFCEKNRKINYLFANIAYGTLLLLLIGTMLFCLTKQLYLAWLSIIFEIIVLLLIFVYFEYIIMIIKYNKKLNERNNKEKLEIQNECQNEEDPEIDNIENNDENINENNRKSEDLEIDNIENDNIKNDKEQINENSKKNEDIHFISDDNSISSETLDIDTNSNVFSMIKITTCKGMLDLSRYKDYNICNGIFVLISAIVILGLQLYSIIYPFVKKRFGVGNFILYLFVKLVFLPKNVCLNILDGITSPKKVTDSLKETMAKAIYWIVFALHIFILVAFIVLYVLFGANVLPSINNALYIEDNTIWNKFNNSQPFIPEGFCYSHAKSDGSFKTEDFAMMTTLSRLYGTNKNGKCFIKPSMRGLFNTTMKYIFGKKYENDGIEIFCKNLNNYIVLVIRSEKILNETLNRIDNKEQIQILDKQFNIINKDYFKEKNISELPEEGKNLLNKYNECVSLNNAVNCENEWDMFTQYYWPNMYSDDYVDIPGFEKYQINIDSDMIIQPSFIDSNNQPNSGTHYIVGGSYNDRIGIGIYAETLGKKYIPLIFQNIIFLYSLFRSVLDYVFTKFDWFNSKLVYIDFTIQKDMSALTELYSQFNFSHDALFTIGHSISASEMKGVSSVTNIRGITFESIEADALDSFNVNKKFKTNEKGNFQIVNIYSDENFFTGNDGKCIVNGKLPKRYYFPNVYDTTCLTVISCSETMKYVPFCKQVLDKTKSKSIEEFEKSFKAYLDQHGY